MLNRRIKQAAGQVISGGGFTLIEILVATAIASIIMIMVTTAYNSMVASISDVTAYAGFYEDLNLAVYRIDKDISNAYFNKSNKENCFIAEKEGANSILNFVTTEFREFNILGNLKRPVPSSDIKEVGYYLEMDRKSKNDTWLLIRREDKHYDSEPLEGGETNILLRNVVSLDFTCKQGNDWTERWDSRQNKRVPAAVRTRLKVINNKNKEEVFEFISALNMK
jgi:type II secretion system protein J